MEPQITISEKLFKRLSRTIAIFAGLLFAFVFFVFDIYKDCNENGVTLFSINLALIMSILLGVTIFVMYSLLNSKYWQKQIIENDNVEKTKSQKVFPIILGSFALLALVGRILYFNHFQFANIVFWVGGVFCFIALLVVALIFKRKNK